MTNILVYGKIFDKIRPKKYYFHCMMCIGFAVGVFVSFFINLDINYFFSGCLSSGTSYILGMLVDDEGFKINRKSS